MKRKKIKTPKEAHLKKRESFARCVRSNEFRFLSDPACSPSGFAVNLAPNYMGELIIGTVYNPETPIVSKSPFIPKARSIVYLEKIWRLCSHDGTKHFNADLHCFWTGQHGSFYHSYANNNPDHYLLVTSGTTLPDLLNEAHLPEEDCGLLEELGYQKHKLSLHRLVPRFEMTGWKDKKPLP